MASRRPTLGWQAAKPILILVPDRVEMGRVCQNVHLPKQHCRIGVEGHSLPNTTPLVLNNYPPADCAGNRNATC